MFQQLIIVNANKLQKNSVYLALIVDILVPDDYQCNPQCLLHSVTELAHWP